MITRQSKWTPILISSLIFVGLIAAVEYWIGWREVLSPWLQLPPQQTAGAMLLVLCSYAVRTLRLVSYFSSELGGRFAQALKLMLLHNLWNNLLPMRTGELSFPLLMQRYFAIAPSRSLPALFWFRLLDLYVVLMLAVVSMLLLQGNAGLALVLAVLLSLVIPLTYRWLPRLVGHFERRVSGKLQQTLAKIRQALPASRRQLLHSCGWTILNWTLKLAVFAWIMQQFIAINFSQALLGAIGGELTSVLPVHGVAGAGTYEAGVIAALLPTAIDPQQALKAALNLHLFLLSCTLLSGLVSYFIPGNGTSRQDRKAL